MGDTSFVFHGDNHFIQTGENAKGVQNNYQNRDKPIDLEAFLKGLESVVKSEESDAKPADNEAWTGAVYGETVAADVRNTAYDVEGKEDYDIEHTQSVLERFQAFIGKAGPKLTKALIAFGTETATAYVGENPIVRGVIAAIQTLQEPE